MTANYLKGGALQLVGGVITKSEKKHYSKRGRPKKESPILERKFYVYADNPEMAERWKSTADNAGVPISKYFRELIEEHTVTEGTEISNQIERLTKPLHDSKSEIQNINNEKFLNDNTSRNILEYEQKLKMNPKEKEKLRNIANSIQDGIIMTDDFGKISFWNQPDERIFGYMNNTVLGKQFVDIIFPEDTKDEMAQRFISLGKTEDGLLLGETVEVVAKRKDGSIFPMELSFSRLKINDEWHSLYIVRDNTKRKEAETKVREIKDSYDRITDNADEIIFRVEAEGGHVIYANPAAERLLGYSKDELLTDPNLGFKIIHPDYAEKQKKIIEEINAKKNPIKNAVLGWICKDGREIIVEYTIIPVLDEVGKIIYFESIGRDITERKKAEDALKESEARYRLLYEKSADGILIADVETKRFLFANPAICTMLQYSEEELIRMSVGDIHPKESLSHVFAEFEAQAKRKKTLAENIPCLCKDGGILYADVNATSMFIDGRKYNVGLFRDITQRKKAEEVMRLHTEMVKNMTEGVYIIGLDDIIIKYANPKFEEMLGYDLGEMAGKHVSIVNAPTDLDPKERADEITKTICETGEWHGEVLNIKKDGTKFWCYANVSTFEHPTYGKVLMAIHSDINEKKKAEESLRASEERFRQFFENEPEYCYMVSPDGEILDINSSALSTLGYNKEELLGKNLLTTIYAPSSRKNVKDLFIKWKKTKQIKNEELNIITKTGEERTILLSAHAQKDVDGKIIHSILVQNDITERKKAEGEIIRTKNHLQNIINSDPRIIFTVNKDNKVSVWNKTAELITGYKRREIVGRSITQLNVFYNPQELADNLKNLINGEKTEFYELILKTKEGVKKIIRLPHSFIKDTRSEDLGILVIGEDITYDRKQHGKLLNGHSYFISDEDKKSAVGLFLDLVASGHAGLFITRANCEELKSMVPLADIQVALLKQNKMGGIENVSDLNGLMTKIKEFSEKNINPVILLDRIDYLLTNFSFKQVIKSLYQINETTSENNSLLLVHLNPSVLDSRELAIIKEELCPLPGKRIDDIRIEDELYYFLKFINEQNQNNIQVSLKKIRNEFSISYPTIERRCKTLENKGLIFTKKSGRSKILHISEKGKTLLNKIQFI